MTQNPSPTTHHPQPITIIGYGRFGRTLHRLLKDDFEITIYYHRDKPLKPAYSGAKVTRSLDKAYKNQTIFYSVPIPKFESVIKNHKNHFRDDHILIDCLSVKTLPEKVLNKALKDTKTQAILTHPMFGPDSSRDGFKGLPMVMDKFRASKDTYEFWKNYFLSKQLKIIELTAKEHDKLAANSQGVAHLVGRILGEYNFKPTEIDTLGAIKLKEIMDQTCNDTWELFEGLQNYNPYTKQMRDRFEKAYKYIDQGLTRTSISGEQPNTQNPIPITPIVGIQGGKGSFNEQALGEIQKTIASQRLVRLWRKIRNKDEIKNSKIKYLYTTKRVLKELDEGKIDYGLFAMHNSVGGIVTESVHAIADHKFKIEGEYGIKIQHYMMKPKHVSLKKIDTIMTHPQVLKQCKSTLAKKYSNLKLTSGTGDLIDHANVAKAMSKGEISDNIAVMGPKILAELYDLEIIAENLQDDKENTTVFMLVSKT